MALNWIPLEQYPFDSFALFERFQIRLVCDHCGDDPPLRESLASALRAHPTVAYAFTRKCPERREFIDALLKEAAPLPPDELRKAELVLMERSEDFIVYLYPEIMDESCDFIYAWDAARLYEMADFRDQVVLDVGSGSGRLAFAAAKLARHVYASEPVATLREYLRDTIRQRGIANMTVVDGMADALPYPDDLFDITMSGHVVGDDTENEIAELRRVTKDGGWILDCPGEDARRRPPTLHLPSGWESMHYISVLGGDVYRYRTQVKKT